jgi:hypothetical protein
MQTFDHLLNWTLKKGSHRFPGPDGGTCINEAAVVAAGFPYACLRTVESMPACFSRPICRLGHDAERPRHRRGTPAPAALCDPAGLCRHP